MSLTVKQKGVRRVLKVLEEFTEDESGLDYVEYLDFMSHCKVENHSKSDLRLYFNQFTNNSPSDDPPMNYSIFKQHLISNYPSFKVHIQLIKR